MRATYDLAVKWFDALRNGRFEELYSYMDENILWENCRVLEGYNDVIPWLGTYHGKFEVAKTFEIYGELSKTENFDLIDIFADGNIILVHAYETNRVIETGTIYHADVFYQMKREGDKITEWKAFWDTAEAVYAFKKKHLVDDEIPEFLYAAGCGDIESVKNMLCAGADINQTDKMAGATALHKACQGGHLEIVKYLVEHGIHINAVAASTGHTALMDAIWFKQTGCCRYLLENGADTGISTNYGFTIDEHIDFALKVNKQPKEQEKLEKIRQYLEERRRRDSERAGEALFKAVLNNDLAGVKAAVSAGADIEMRYPVVNGFNDGHTPLIIASRENEADIVRYLLEQGADANATEPVFGAVPLHKATYNGLPVILKILLSVPGIDINCQGYTNGYTPLHDALWHGFDKCADILVDYGANLHIKGHDGKLPLDIAVEVFGNQAPITDKIRKRMAAGR